MVGFYMHTSVWKDQSSRIKIDDVMHPAMGVDIILIQLRGLRISTLSLR